MDHPFAFFNGWPSAERSVHWKEIMNVSDPAWKQILCNGAAEMAIHLNPGQADQLAVHARELLAWNKAFNITAIIDPEEMAVKHYLDCLALVRHLDGRPSLLDIGSGGGFPGIVLKIACPDLTVVMVDAARKRISFLKHMIRLLDLKGITAVHSRAEELAVHADYAGMFECVTSRAFAALGDFATAALPFLSRDGIILAMKGVSVAQEIDGVVSGRFLIDIQEYLLSGSQQHRSVVRLTPVMAP